MHFILDIFKFTPKYKESSNEPQCTPHQDLAITNILLILFHLLLPTVT